MPILNINKNQNILEKTKKYKITVDILKRQLCNITIKKSKKCAI